MPRGKPKGPEPGGAASSEPSGDSERRARATERYRTYAAVAGYAGLFAVIALVFFNLLVGGLDERWARLLFLTLFGIAGVAVLGGIGVNYERVLDLFRSRKGVAGMSVALAVALGTVILVLTNYISYRRSKSWDVTEDARFTLSEQTTNWLRRLDAGDKTLRVVTFIPYDVKSQITGMPRNARQRVVELLKLYDERSRKLLVEHTEVERHRARAIEIARALGFREDRVPNESVILKYGDKRRNVKLQDMIKAQSPMFGMGRGGPPVFKEEDAITSAIRNLLDDRPKRVYFLTGHGERTPGYDPLDMSTAVEDLKGMNFKIEELDLAEKGGVPDDADCLILAGPTRPIPSGGPGIDELAAIEEYLEQGGSMLVMLDNTVTSKGHRPSGIERVLEPYGVTVRQKLVAVGLEMRSGPVTKGVPNASNEVSQPFRRRQVMLYQPCCLETEKARKERFGVRTILEGTDGSWGESEFGRQLRYDKDKDLEGPTILGVSVVPVGEDAAKRARIVVFSDVDWLTNQILEDPVVRRFSVNVDLFAASVNWMVGRMENIGIPPREEDVRVADVRPGQRKQLFVGIVVGPVLMMIALGVYVWRVRSR